MSDVDNRILGLREYAPDDWWRTELTRLLRSAREERESLQRENENLKLENAALMAKLINGPAFRAAAITPEMRERIMIALYEEFSEPEDHCEYCLRIFRDLLGERG